jgi:tetratricopeptide (TPR) repeat protein
LEEKNISIEDAMMLGIEAHKAGKVQEADRYYTAVLKVQPKHPDANHNMGVLAVGVGKVEEALPFLKTALEVNASIAQYWLSYINALIKLEKLVDAKAACEQARENSVEGEALEQLEQRVRSEEQVSNTPSQNQEPSKEELNALVSLYNQNRFGQVFKEAQKLTNKYSKSLTLWNLMGASAAQIGQLDEAVIAFKKAISIKPDYADAYNNLGNALQDQGKLAEAIEAYNKALSIKPDYAEAHNNMGVTLKEHGKLVKAIEAYNKAISLKPDYADAYNNLGTALQDQGKLGEAIEAYNKALSIKPDLAGACNNLGTALKNQGKLAEAIEAYNKARSIKPDYAEATTNLAILFFESKRFEEAAKLFSMDNSIKNQSYLLKCFYELEEKSKFYNQLDYLIEQGNNNCVIGSYISQSKTRYGINKENPFCNDPFKYVIKTDLSKKCDFKKVFVENAASVLSDGEISHKSQGHLTNGIQTSGNIFDHVGSMTNLWREIIQSELKNYKNNFCDSEEGLIRDWPLDYSIYGWLVSMKNGGELSAHIHDTGWITGSIYINVPPKSKKDSGNLVVATHDPKYGKGNTKDIKSIDVVTGSLCLFPSSLLHYTIPFQSNEDRVVLAFDMIPN